MRRIKGLHQHTHFSDRFSGVARISAMPGPDQNKQKNTHHSILCITQRGVVHFFFPVVLEEKKS